MLSIGDVVAGKYRLDALLGQGGMGTVYAATHLVTQKRLALKVILPRDAADETARGRLLREAQVAGRIHHPNVIDVYDVGEHGGAVFLVMELLDGYPLSSLLTHGPMQPLDAIRLLMPALRGVAAAHASGVVHRDLKPENIFVSRDSEGTTRHATVLDFGISRPADDTDMALTRTGAMMGTPMYMAPEQLAGVTSVDVRIDVYALGVLLYEMVAGHAPFEGDTFALLASAKLNEDPISVRDFVPSTPKPFEKVLMKALERDPRDRFPDVPSFATALEPFAGGVVFRTSEHVYTPAPSIAAPSTAMSIETDRIARRSSSRVPWIAAVLVVLLVGVVGGTLVAIGITWPAAPTGPVADTREQLAVNRAPVGVPEIATPMAVPDAGIAAVPVVRGIELPPEQSEMAPTGAPPRPRGRRHPPGRTGNIRVGEF